MLPNLLWCTTEWRLESAAPELNNVDISAVCPQVYVKDRHRLHVVDVATIPSEG